MQIKLICIQEPLHLFVHSHANDFISRLRGVHFKRDFLPRLPTHSNLHSVTIKSGYVVTRTREFLRRRISYAQNNQWHNWKNWPARYGAQLVQQVTVPHFALYFPSKCEFLNQKIMIWMWTSSVLALKFSLGNRSECEYENQYRYYYWFYYTRIVQFILKSPPLRIVIPIWSNFKGVISPDYFHHYIRHLIPGTNCKY